MDFFAIGQKIKELRKQAGFSQSELAEGICTQAQISKIEKGDVYPYASTLYLISKKLGVDVNYFFDIGMTPRLDYVQEVSYQLKITRRSMNYEEMRQIVETEEKNPLFIQNKRNYQLLLWHKGIYEYMLNKNVEKAIDILEQAITLTQPKNKILTEKEIELLLSIGVIYSEEHLHEKALETYNTANTHMKSLPYLNDCTIKTRLLYNLARTHTRLGQFKESIKYCEEAIKWCLQKENLYLLGELHYHLGYNYELKENFQTASKYMKKAYFILDLQNNKRFTAFIKEKLEGWKKEGKTSILLEV
ncbi:helix-turn-helix domain-containing protein [Peribacillus tepidiphilus]|uniref:helix-turn-helix domain-containing protein n=1 Tax=Peribacillus tepidiphilus TaxID=2652445 RepID=UPI001292ABEA|nr:tetratricopeptide repeat protein [Peribacillus tepidiphilus]